MALWKARPLRVLLICMVGLIALMLLLITLLDRRIGLSLIAFFVGFYIVVMGLVMIAMVTYRLLDRRRLVLLTDDGTAGVDVVFRRGKSLAVRNHGRTFGSKVAPRMRHVVAEWVRPVLTADFTISAQNQRVAQLYMEQFPELQIVGRDWMGHPKLAMRERTVSDDKTIRRHNP